MRSSVGGPLVCFRVSAAVSSAAVSMGVRVPFGISVFSGYMPRVGLLDHMIILCVVF